MRVEDAVTFRGIQGRQPCKGGYLRRKGPLLPLRKDAFAGAAKVWFPDLLDLGSMSAKVRLGELFKKRWFWELVY